MSVIRMLRATLIGRIADAEAMLTAVQAAGLLHVQRIAPPGDGDGIRGSDDTVLRDVARMEAACHVLLAVHPEAPQSTELDVDAVLGATEALVRRRDDAAQRMLAVDSAIEALEPWGEIDPDDLDLLEAAHSPVTFVRLTWNDWRAIDPSNVPHAVVMQTELDLCIVFFGPEAAELPLVSLRLPRVRLSVAQAERVELQAELMRIERSLGALSHCVPALEKRRADLADMVEVLRTRDGGLHEGPVFAVQGYLPAENQVDLQRAVAAYSAALQFDDPEIGEPVPVKLRNGPFSEGFEAIVRSFSGISYWEKDFTPTVGLLFLLFGSLCLVDGGYGVLLLILGVILRIKGQRAFGNVFALTGAFATLVGLLAGQYFGFVVGKDGFMAGHQPPTPLASDPMASFIFSLMVGLAGMTYSYAVAIWQRGWRTSATGSLVFACGAIVMALGAFAPGALANLLVARASDVVVASVGDGLGVAGRGLLGLGVAAWMLWPEQVFGESRVPNVLWTLYSGITGLGQDVMSHMRLFGIALSGSIMAMVVNQITGLFPLPVTIVLAIIGHLFVFVLSLLSLYIHTNRLIFLEFGSKCIDGGHAWYAPLRRTGVDAQKAAA
jgi:V/A-type H+/Na+-transporting ATPase subunit I